VFTKENRILAIGAHPDDIELGCGGTLAKLKELEAEICCLVLSDKMETGHFRDLEEMFSSLSVLGISPAAVQTGNIPTRVFAGFQPKIRETLISVRQHFLPHYIFCPSGADLHQDHRVVYEEVRRIFRNHSVFGYEIIRSSLDFKPQLYIDLQGGHLRKKIAALRCYQSQINGGSAGYYFKPRVIRAGAVLRGAHAAMPLAEAFEVYCLRL